MYFLAAFFISELLLVNLSLLEQLSLISISSAIQVGIVEDSLPSSRVSATTSGVLGNKLGKAVSMRVCSPPPDITGAQAGLTGDSKPGAWMCKDLPLTFYVAFIRMSMPSSELVRHCVYAHRWYSAFLHQVELGEHLPFHLQHETHPPRYLLLQV